MKIAIIGGGPRGLCALERIIEWARNEQSVQITMFDPYGPGGKVWRDQSVLLMMNSVVSQVTLFTDETLSTSGPVVKGPNLYEWLKQEAIDFIQKQPTENKDLLIKECEQLGPNDHCSRALYGFYQQWFYTYLQTRMTDQTSVKFFKDTVRAVKKQMDTFQVYTKAVEITVDKVILALGHQEIELSNREKKLAAYASEHRLYYSAPKNAADASLEALKDQAPVIIRGLGLVFFDYLTLLTKGRGGVFQEKAGELVYHPSGREPKIIAGSGRGIPYHARGLNQKDYGEEYRPHFLKEKTLNKFRRKEKLSAQQFFLLLQKEVELVYYLALIKEHYSSVDAVRFTEAFVRTKGAESILQKFGIKKEEYWDWSIVQQPQQTFDTQVTLLDYLTWDYAAAKKGNLSGPFAAALDSLKDLRDEVRFMLDHEIFTDDEAKKWLWEWFTPLNAFLSIGPPLERIAELKALIEAGIVTILKEQMDVATQNGTFITFSKKEPEKSYAAHFLIEARLPKVANQFSLNPLTQQLLQSGLAANHQLELSSGAKFSTGALLVERQNNQMIATSGAVVKGLFCYGIPTEGIHWLTATTARPGTDPRNMREADTIAATIFHNQ
ncbi:oxidoreductase [Erwinia sp. CPCC 100877]|nr:oxidoreductase [Erwinia sp. CPCC 100877]